MTHSMPSLNTYVLTGDIIALSPLASCGPSLAASARKGEPTPIPTVSLDGATHMYLPSGGLRHRFRAGTMRAVETPLRRAANDGPIYDLAHFLLHRSGGIKQGGEEVAMTAAETEAFRQAAPTLSLFGISTPWIKGKVSVGAMVCASPINEGEFEPQVIDGVRADPMRRNPADAELLKEGALDVYDAAVQAARSESTRKKAIADLDRAIRAATTPDEKTRLRQEKAALEEGKSGAVSLLMPLAGFRAIPAGAMLTQTIILRRVTQIELGAFCAAADHFCDEPLGAHAANGAGRVKGVYRVTRRDWEQRCHVEVGSIAVETDGFAQITGDVLVQARAAFASWAASPANNPFLPGHIAAALGVKSTSIAGKATKSSKAAAA